jgi:hypothetical protein
MFILPEGQTGETWELSEIEKCYVEKYLRLVLVLSTNFGPTKGCNNRAKQRDARDSIRILNCEAEARSDSHCPGVAIADFWVKQNTHKHTHTHSTFYAPASSDTEQAHPPALPGSSPTKPQYDMCALF